MKLLKSKWIWILPLILLLAFLLIPIVSISIADFKDQKLVSGWQMKMASKLSQANSQQQAFEVISKLGVVLGTDQSWIAIDYQDTHNGRIASAAVARTSTGEIYISDEHFCGMFSGYQHAENQIVECELRIQESSDPEVIQFYQELLDSDDLRHPLLLAIDAESDPAKQRELLIELGFKPID